MTVEELVAAAYVMARELGDDKVEEAAWDYLLCEVGGHVASDLARDAEIRMLDVIDPVETEIEW